MLQDLINYPDQLSLDEISSPISAQIFDYCDPELFQETLQNSEVTSCSNCCYDENSSYATNFTLPQDIDNNFSNYQDINGNMNSATTATVTGSNTSTSTTTATTAILTNNNDNLSIIFNSHEEVENDITASIDFSVSQFLTNQAEQFDFSSIQTQIPLADIVDGLPHYRPDQVTPLMAPPLASIFDEDCLSPVPSYIPLNLPSTSCSFVGHPMGTYMPGTLTTALSTDSTSFFAGSIMIGSEQQTQELEFHGDTGGIYCPDSLQHVLNAGDLQAPTNESHRLVSHANSTPLPSDMSVLDESSFKVGKLSVEQRKEKIHRYMKKRNERNFSKKIKYACRKTLADRRPRVRGRFAKNDDFGESHRPTSSHHEEDDEEEAVVKEEEEMVDSSDIFAHISGVNSFKCNYPIHSWI